MHIRIIFLIDMYIFYWLWFGGDKDATEYYSAGITNKYLCNKFGGRANF